MTDIMEYHGVYNGISKHNMILGCIQKVAIYLFMAISSLGKNVINHQFCPLLV